MLSRENKESYCPAVLLPEVQLSPLSLYIRAYSEITNHVITLCQDSNSPSGRYCLIFA